MSKEEATQQKIIAERIVELREILGIGAPEMARRLNIGAEQYAAYENAAADIPIGTLYAIAGVLNVDPTELMSGDAPRMENYTLVRSGAGLNVERYKGYSFASLAYNYKRRVMDPMVVTIAKGEKDVKPVAHRGQEFNYCLSGAMKVTVGGRELVLNEGDSLYFNPTLPHMQIALTDTAVFLTVINDFR
ncbi:MAG: cupin domain-containing protein [Firmicutes bacterium]|nr:cupin domain-containing protein [Bacillota bacterium]